MKVILLDDEDNALELLEMILTDIGGIEIIDTYLSPFAFLEGMQKLKWSGHLPDAVFVDIEMPDMFGLEVAEKVHEIDAKVQVIFVTAYSEYAIQAFEVHAQDYILKPASKERIEKTLNHIRMLTGKADVNNGAESEIQIQCMGEFAIFRNREMERVKWRTSKARELCAYLLHEHNRIVATDTLLELFFENEDSEKSKVYLYSTVSYVRKIFNQLGFPNALQKLEDGYVINVSGIQCDYLELLEIVSEETPIVVNNIERYERLFDLYKGDFIQNVDHIAFMARREDVRQQTVHTLRRMKDFYKASQNEEKVMHCLFKIVELMPDSEHDTYELMKVYNKHGERGEALKVYQQFVRHLAEEYGLSPSKKMLRFAQTLLNGEGDAT